MSLKDNAKIILLSLVILFNANDLISQKRYSIDHGKIKKSGRIEIKYKLYQFKQNREKRKELRAERKETKKIQKYKRKHVKELQTKETQKQMKELYRSAERINSQKPQNYLHERILNKVVERTKVTYVKSKLMVEQSVESIKDLLSFSDNKSKNERYFNNEY